ncbi:MAG: 4-hydroxythreonine-4-phosphate dehydrogenase PdxA [Polyangiaceae bacterium]
MSRPPRSVVAVSVGCPSGIGPEVAVVAAAADPSIVLVCDPRVVAAAVEARCPGRGLTLVSSRSEALRDTRGSLKVWAGSSALGAPVRPGAPDAAAGRAQLAWVDEATALVVSGFADALATGPVSKHAIATSGARGARGFLGHTEHLMRKLGAREVVMAFWSEQLTTALATTHLSLRDVPVRLTARAVSTGAYWLARLVCALGTERPRIAIAALNPHAGEGGLLGDEEPRVLAPGIRRARARLASDGFAAELAGPIGAESAFRKAVLRAGVSQARDYDAVLAMYHDQATIPSKLLAFGEAVNVTLGLPIIRTSVDHGTGYDLAGKGTADAAGMVAAVDLAKRMAVAPARVRWWQSARRRQRA